MSRLWRRKATNVAAVAICLAFTGLAVWPLFSVVAELVHRGGPGLSWAFLTELPTAPSRPGGGIKHAIIGTGMVVGIGTAIGAPVGLLAGIYLSEYGPSRFASLVRSTADVMTGIPSIVAGIFAYAVIVSRIGYSAYAAGVALALIMLPIVTRTTEEALRTVPQSYREASLALGAPRWYTIAFVVLPPAASAVATGLLLSISRIAGETAPLILTMLANFFLSTDPSKSVETLPTLIYRYGTSYTDKQLQQSWTAALVLIGLVLVINVAVRVLTRRRPAAT